MDRQDWDDLVQDVCIAIRTATGCYGFSQAAQQRYDAFYKKARQRYTSEATARVDLHAKKLGLVYAILAEHGQVEADDIESGISVAEYCAGVVEPLAARLDASPQKQIEERLLALLSEGPLSAREAYRRLHVSAGELGRAANSLRQFDQIQFDGRLYSLKA